MKPLAVDLFCGLGGWTDGLLAAGFDVIGFDNERHEYGEHRYPGQLVLQDVLTLDGAQFKGARLIVASPPCQEFSYMAMPWTRAKRMAAALRGEGDFPEGYGGSRTRAELTALFDACFRIQSEASAAAGRHIPLVVENVRGAQAWVGRARWHHGSFYLWGDVPALMPIVQRSGVKVGGIDFNGHGTPGYKAQAFNGTAEARLRDEIKVTGKNPVHDGVKVASLTGHRTAKGNGVRFTSRDCGIEGTKQPGIGGPRENGKGDAWFQNGAARHGSKSTARKAASAMIAKIPFSLARHIGEVYLEATP